MNALIEELKQAKEDFEFYPTTDEIIDKLARDIKASGYETCRSRSYNSILDIGAGNGPAFDACGCDAKRKHGERTRPCEVFWQ